MDLNDLYRKNWNCEFGCKHTRKIIITSAVPRCAQPLAPFDCGCIAIKKFLVLPRGYREFINYPGSFFFVKALITLPLPSCLPNRGCFHPKMVCFSFFSFFVSQDLHATSRLVLRHTICVCSCIVKRICKVFTLTHVQLGLQETLQQQCECQLTSQCSAARLLLGLMVKFMLAIDTHFQGVMVG